MPVFTVNNILTEPTADQVAQDYLDSGCTTAEKEQQADGKWKVVADCPEN